MYAQIAAALLAVWLTAAPEVLGYPNPARANDHIVGPVAATAALTAVFQVTRGVRWVNVLAGGWLVLAPWVLRYPGWAETINALAVGGGVGALAWVPGAAPERMGGGWTALWRAERRVPPVPTAGRRA